ncbi:metallophosphoesterase [candidate division WOR-3 bacterium]|nr:metallophosphoesterase [candidate division WOR-3 bacterium]
MILGVLSDIHGNLEALTAVLQLFNEKGVQTVLCAGDIVGYGPDPERCIEQLQKIGAKTVAGNHEWGVLGRTDIDSFNHSARFAIKWTQKRLSAAQREYLGNLPLIYQFGPIHMVHAAPSDPSSWDYLLSLEDVAGEMGAFTQDICIVGHTHIPMAVERISGSRVQLKKADGFYIREDAKYLLNTGSVGQPRDGDTRACCLIINMTERSVSFYRVGYDIRATQQKMRQAGLPEELAERLARGR